MLEHHRQEVLNVLIAQLLQERGVISAPEQILDVANIPRRKMPDVLVYYNGLRTLIEGEVGDQPAFWSHDAETVYTMAQQPNAYLMPLHKAKEGRNLRKVEDLWPLAGSIVIVERMWLNTQKLTAARLAQPVLSNTWWPLRPKKRHASAQRQKVLLLWLNSTLGILTLVGHREETRGAWVKFKKPVLSAMPVLDIASLSQSQLRQLAAAYDRLCNHALLPPLPQMANDNVRAELDNALARALGLPDLAPLRTLLAREPVVSLQPL
ncbi:MAG: hypothetical protein N3D11_03160 [Candidatus Sumerlaeia bacterium]|nr:hypothetical protein [Candidatus Sumerlaeia bacterium]